MPEARICMSFEVFFISQDSTVYQHLDANSDTAGAPVAWDAAPPDHTPRSAADHPPQPEEGAESGDEEEMDTSQPNEAEVQSQHSPPGYF